jgi:hypothetical protein
MPTVTDIVSYSAARHTYSDDALDFEVVLEHMVMNDKNRLRLCFRSHQKVPSSILRTISSQEIFYN